MGVLKITLAGYRLRRREWNIVVSLALVMSVVVVGIVELQSQTIAPSTSSSGAEFYLKRGEDLSGVHQYNRAIDDYTTAIKLKPDFRYAYINRANARLFSHPWLALQDFHRAGMHPERTVAILASVLMVAVAATFLLLRRRRIRGPGASDVG